MSKGDEEIGQLSSRVSCEPVEDVGALGEDRGDAVIRVPRGEVGGICEVPGEEGFGATASVPCFQKDVMEDDGEREGLVGIGNPCFEAGVQLC